MIFATRQETESILDKMPLLPDYWKYTRFMIANIQHKVHRRNRATCWDTRLYLNPMSVMRWSRKNGLCVKKHNGPMDAWEFTICDS